MAFLWLWITLAFRGGRATKNQTKCAFHVVLAVLRLAEKAAGLEFDSNGALEQSI